MPVVHVHGGCGGGYSQRFFSLVQGVVVSRLLTPAEAAVEARCSRAFIYDALLTGELPGIQRRKPKGRWLIEAEALSRWVRGQ